MGLVLGFGAPDTPLEDGEVRSCKEGPQAVEMVRMDSPELDDSIRGVPTMLVVLVSPFI